MSVWTGWQADLLKAAGFPNTAANRSFLTAWHNHAQSNCKQNPVDISKQEPGSTNCKHLGPGRTAQNYRGPGDASRAFAQEINGAEFVDLNAGFRNSSLTVTNASASVIGELQIWGSVKFATFLQAGGGTGAPGSGGPVHFHQGWDDVRRAVNVRYHASMKSADALTGEALRKLAKARKVRL